MTSPFQSGDPAFESFWAHYPRKEPSKAATFECWKKVINNKKLGRPAEILEGLHFYKFNPDPQFQPYATTWLNQRRWQIEKSTPPPLTIAPTGRGAWMDKYDRSPDPTIYWWNIESGEIFTYTPHADGAVPADLFAGQNLLFGGEHGDD